jgi:hypothetical protein
MTASAGPPVGRSIAIIDPADLSVHTFIKTVMQYIRPTNDQLCISSHPLDQLPEENQK